MRNVCEGVIYSRRPVAWVDLYEASDFTGERRRFFGPARIDARALMSNAISLRLAAHQALRIVFDDGNVLTVDADAAFLDLSHADTLELVDRHVDVTRAAA